MKLRVLISTLMAALAVPGAALAAPTSGVLLDVNPAHHTVEVIDQWLLVHSYHYRGSVAGLQPGALVAFSAHGRVARQLHARGSSRAPVRFLARIVRTSGHGVTLRLSDGRRLSLPGATVASMFRGYKRGATVVVTLPGSGGHGNSVSLQGLGGSRSGSSSGGGGGGVGGSNPTVAGPDQNVIGTITSVSGGGLTVNTTDGRTLQFTVDDPSITDGYLIGDQVTVTYNPMSDGSLDASDVEYDDQNVSGVVTAVTQTSITIINSATGQPMTLVDPTLSDQMFQGVNVGDTVEIQYYNSAIGLQVDNLTD